MHLENENQHAQGVREAESFVHSSYPHVPECRPYWQLSLIGVIIGLFGLIGNHATTITSTLHPLLLAIIIVVLCAAFRHFDANRFVALLLDDSNDNEYLFSTKELILWPVAGCAAVLTALVLLERVYPYYFTQDDNLGQNLPSILQGCRSLFNGVFPTWNPHQYLGSPNATVGWYALTYPFTYLSYWFAKTVLGNENATIEVFSFLHLLLGYLALYWCIRREGVRPSLAMLASSCCILSGFALIFSRSWFQFSPILLWTPLMAVCVQELIRGKTGWKWIVAFGATIGIFFHAGHIQMWTYSVLLIDIAIVLLVIAGAVPPKAIVSCLAAHFVGLAIASPLLVPELLATHNVTRYPDSAGIASGLKGLFIPDSVSVSLPPPGFNGIHLGEMYYSGTLFTVVVALLLLSLLATCWGKRTVKSNVWFLCALLAFLLALGDRGIVWTLLARLPGFDRFRWPFKFVGHFVLFSVIGGAVAIERLMRNKRQWEKFAIPLTIVVMGVLAYHCTLCDAAFYKYGFSPYPQPDRNIVSRLVPEDDRYYSKVLPAGGPNLISFAPYGFKSDDPHFIDSFMNQWSTLEGSYSADGYDQLVSESPAVHQMVRNFVRNPTQSSFEYGIKYILQYGRPLDGSTRVYRELPGASLVYQSATVFLTELPAPRPMSFPEAEPGTALPVKFDGAGATITTSEVPQGGSIMLNMLWRDEIQCRVNGSKVPVGPDSWGRIRMQIPPGVSQVRVAFRPPWELGWMAGALSLICAIGLGWLSSRLFHPANATPVGNVRPTTYSDTV